jgi:hypothetical protein
VIRFLLRVLVFLGSSAIGLLVASWLVPGVSVRPLGFVTAVVIFTVAQAILSPFFLKMASRYASAFLRAVPRTERPWHRLLGGGDGGRVVGHRTGDAVAADAAAQEEGRHAVNLLWVRRPGPTHRHLGVGVSP